MNCVELCCTSKMQRVDVERKIENRMKSPRGRVVNGSVSIKKYGTIAIEF